jgi:hypothetical protein
MTAATGNIKGYKIIMVMAVYIEKQPAQRDKY